MGSNTVGTGDTVSMARPRAQLFSLPHRGLEGHALIPTSLLARQRRGSPNTNIKLIGLFHLPVSADDLDHGDIGI